MGVLTPSWLLGPCPLLAQHPLQFGLGKQRQEWQLSPLPGDRQPLEIASEPPFLASGGDGPLPCSVPPGQGGAPHSRGLYIHFVSRSPPPCCMHIILYSQSIVLGPAASTPAASYWGGRVVGVGAVTGFGPPQLVTLPGGFVEAGTGALRRKQ